MRACCAIAFLGIICWPCAHGALLMAARLALPGIALVDVGAHRSSPVGIFSPSWQGMTALMGPKQVLRQHKTYVVTGTVAALGGLASPGETPYMPRMWQQDQVYVQDGADDGGGARSKAGGDERQRQRA